MFSMWSNKHGDQLVEGRHWIGNILAKHSCSTQEQTICKYSPSFNWKSIWEPESKPWQICYTPNMIRMTSDNWKGRQFEKLGFLPYPSHSISINSCEGTTPFLVHWLVGKKNLKLVKRRQKYQRFLSLQHTPILLRQELFTLWCAIIERNTSVSILQSLPHDQCN